MSLGAPYEFRSALAASALHSSKIGSLIQTLEAKECKGSFKSLEMEVVS